MLIRVRNRSVMSLPALERMVLRFIYRGKKVIKGDDGNMAKVKDMSHAEIQVMFDSMQHWVNHFKLKKTRREDAIPGLLKAGMLTEGERPIELQDEYKFMRLLELLKRNEEGKLEYQKKTLAFHGIDYRLFHRLPEMYVGKDAQARMAKAQEEWQKLVRAKPEENLVQEEGE